MSTNKITAILWKKVMEATADTLRGVSKGQYHIELGKGDDITDFFDGCNKIPSQNNGGFEIVLPIHSVGGTSPVESTSVSIKFLGENSSRKTWIISSQRPETAYSLWQEGSAFPNGIGDDNYIVLVKDSLGFYHARWIDDVDFKALPSDVSSRMQSKNFGVLYRSEPEVEPKVQMIINQLKEKTNVLLYGPPGTGKTHLMQEVVKNFDNSFLSIDSNAVRDAFKFSVLASENIMNSFVTFHQSYSYEDFIVGLRPDTNSEKLLSLSPEPGILLELSEFSRTTGDSSLLLIDEINRGNVSRIFGEFITLMEPGKRLAADGSERPSTITIKLPGVKKNSPVVVELDGQKIKVPNPFSLPSNLYTLASMNSVDRSVAPLDAAIRRRFHIVHLGPDMSEIKEQFKRFKSTVPEIETIKKLAIELLEYINESISFFKGKDYQLGHWYLSSLCRKFSDVDECNAILVDVWLHKIIPQIEELFHGRSEQVAKILRLDDGYIAGSPMKLIDPGSEYERLGAVPFFQPEDVSIKDNIKYLAEICEFNLLDTMGIPESIPVEADEPV
tara:strand:- start:6522 stop:8192 length:1671 start_codon:yes stop_codon:yes gene_type:complete